VLDLSGKASANWIYKDITMPCQSSNKGNCITWCLGFIA